MPSDNEGRFWRVRLLVAAAGVAFAIIGLTGLIWALSTPQSEGSRLLDVSETILVVGAVFIGQAILSCRVTIDEAYKLGFDIGNEKGFSDGRRVGRPVVVDLPHPPDDEEVEIRHTPE